MYQNMHQVVPMLFLVIGHPKEGRVLPPRSEFLKLVLREWETVLEQKNAGKVIDVYGFTDGKGGIVIYDVESREELETLLKALPMDPFADWEIKPILNAATALEKTRRKLHNTIGQTISYSPFEG